MYSLIQELDQQIGQLKLENKSAFVLANLLEIRNNLLLKYKPNPNKDWTITNKQALKVLEYFSWVAIYK